MDYKINIINKKKYSCQVTLNNVFFGWFNIKTLQHLKIEDNSILNNEQILTLNNILKTQTYKKALEILSRRDHSKKELILKLQKIANKKVILIIINILQKRGFINDLKYAENFIKKLIYQKCIGLKKILIELKLKGIDSETIDNALNNLNIDNIDPIINIINKKYVDNLNDFKSRQKVIRSLLQKGHNYSDISIALKHFNK